MGILKDVNSIEWDVTIKTLAPPDWDEKRVKHLIDLLLHGHGKAVKAKPTVFDER